jgi:hypothetical protein
MSESKYEKEIIEGEVQVAGFECMMALNFVTNRGDTAQNT